MRRGKGSRGERAECINTLFYAEPERLQKAQEKPLQQCFKGIKKETSVGLELGVSVKCQIKIITQCYYSKNTDTELERGNSETHVPSHHWLLNMRQSLPVGLQAKKQTFICPKVLRGLLKTAPRI